jgi:hypothetical protein
MNPETLDSILKDPKLQAALASKYWSQQAVLWYLPLEFGCPG